MSPPDELLEHRDFLRRLARSLVRDEHAAEDLVQGAWVAALSAPPRGASSPGRLRAWLARTVRNAAHNLRRERERRRAREAEVAQGRSGDSGDPHFDPSVDAELEAQALVVQALRELREPYRTSLHLRYYRDLEPSEIARREGVPLATVETRLARGRALLREALTRRSGGRQTWLAALLPLDVDPSPAAAAAWTLGSWIVGTKLKIGVALAASAVAAALWQWPGTSQPARPEGDAALAAVSAPAAATLPAGSESTVPAPTDPVESRSLAHSARPSEPRAAPTEPEGTEPTGIRLSGRAVGVEGYPLRSTRVRFVPGSESPAGSEPVLAVTDGSGDFEMTVPGGGEVRTDEEGLVTVLAGAAESRVAAARTVVVAAPARTLEVRVEDEGGGPIEGAHVTFEPPDDFRSRFQLNLDRSADVTFRTRTDDGGRAAIAAVPEIPGSTLAAERDGFAPLELPLDAAAWVPRGAPVEVVLTLAHLERQTNTLTGRVVDEYGDGVPDAAVTYRLEATRTDEDGRFFFDLAEVGTPGRWWGEEGAEHDLSAVRAGYLPAVLRPQLDAVSGEPLWPREIVLQPVERPLEIAGRVVDQDGEPLEGYTVFLPEVTLFERRSLEGTVAGGSGFLHSVLSDEGGRFALGGLLPKDYDLAALDTETLLRGDVEGVAAGERNVEIVVDTGRTWSRVRGTVVDQSGAPVAEAVASVTVYTQTARGAQGVWTTSADGTSAQTDERGRFELEDVSMACRLHVEHPDIAHVEGIELPTEDAREADGRLSGIEVVVTLRRRLQVLLADPEEADAFRILDAEGEEMDLVEQTAHSYLISTDNAALTEGRSKHVFVEGPAATLVLLKDGVEVRRAPIELVPRVENALRL